MTDQEIKLLLLALGGVALLVLLTTRLKVNPFIALFLAAITVGLGSGTMGLSASVQSFQDGLGGTLGNIAAIIALGAMLGQLLAESGGAVVLARRFIDFFGTKHIVLCLMALAIAIGFTTWFAVGLILLAPILFTLARETGKPYLMLALPLLACLSTMHGIMPPHPGPVVAVGLLGANMGKLLMWGFLVSLPPAIIAGPVFARFVVGKVPVEIPAFAKTSMDETRPEGVRAPDFGLTLFTMLLPILLMLMGTAAELTLGKENSVRTVLTSIGHPTVALTISVLFGMWSLGIRNGWRKEQILGFTEKCIAAIGTTVLVIGAGGGFARVLKEAGAANALGSLAQQMHLQPLLFGWMVSAFIRVATGSATVAITTAAGLMAPLLVTQYPGVNRELLVISIGCGSLFLSHLNDGGFWLVKESLGLTVGQTFRTWTVLETLIGLAGLGITLLVSNFV